MALRKHCDHCGIEIDSTQTPEADVAQVEPVAKDWSGGNLIVRVVLERVDESDIRRSTPLDLCDQCFGYVLSEATQIIGERINADRRPN